MVPAPPTAPPDPPPRTGWAAAQGERPAPATVPPTRPAGRRWWLLVPVVAVAVVGVVAALQLGRPARTIGEGRLLLAQEPLVLRLSGEVAVVRRTPGQSLPVTDTAVVAADDQVLTGEDGRAVVVWPDGAALAIEPHSRVQLIGQAPQRVRIGLDAGEIWVDAGETADERAATVAAATGLHAEGVRLRARRGDGGSLQVVAYDAPAWLTGGGHTQLVPRGAESVARTTSVPTLPRPLPSERVLAVQVAGADAWALVDRAGRAAGRPPGAASWVGAIPGGGRPRSEGQATTVLVPAAAGSLRLVLWGAGAARRVEIAAWATDLAALGAERATPAGQVLRLTEAIGASEVSVLTLAIDDRAVALSGPPTRGTALPADLRIVAAAGSRPEAPRAVVAAGSSGGTAPGPAAGPSPEARTSADEPPGAAAMDTPAAPAAPSPAPTATARAASTTVATPTEGPATEPSPEPTATRPPARFERSVPGVLPPAPSPTPLPSPTLAAALPSPTTGPTSTPVAVTATPPATAVPSRPPATAVVPTLPATPLPTLAPLPTVPAPRPTTAAGSRGPSPVVPGAPPGGAPPGGLGINAWGGAGPTGGGTPSASSGAGAAPAGGATSQAPASGGGGRGAR